MRRTIGRVRATDLLPFVFAAVMVVAWPSPARAEVSEVAIAQQYGIGYLPLIVMKHERLVERQLARAGLKSATVKWSVLGNAGAMNDGLLGGKLHFASGGVVPMILMWDKTRGQSNEIAGVGALLNAPVYLLTNNPNLRSLKDLGDNDRIAMPGASHSIQSLYLQMATAMEFGNDKSKRLNGQIVSLSHPDAQAALLARSGGITAYFSAPPFQRQALKQPGIHRLVSSYDITGGPTTFLGLWSSSKFRRENPRTFGAFIAALREAMGLIDSNKVRAAEIYLRDTGGREHIDDIVAQLEDPETRYALPPARIMPLVAFMHQAGLIKARPTSWKDVFFPELHALDGS